MGILGTLLVTLLCCGALQLTERRQGNDYFRKGLLDKAMCQYQRAHAVLDMVEGMGKDDQDEIDINKSVVLLNIAAVQLTAQEYAAAADSCSTALVLQPDNVKGLVRRAKCYSHMNEYKVRCSTRKLHVGAMHDRSIHRRLFPYFDCRFCELRCVMPPCRWPPLILQGCRS